MNDWYKEKLISLRETENRFSTLKEIQNKIGEASKLDVAVAKRLLDSVEICECLEATAGEENEQSQELEIAYEILSACMATLSINYNDLPKVLQWAFTHSSTQIRVLALTLTLRELKANRYGNIDVSRNLLEHVLVALQDNYTSVAGPAMEILSLVLPKVQDTHFIKKALEQALQQNEVVKCRVFDLAVNLSRHSEAMLLQVEWILDKMLEELDSEDILLQLNVLEMLGSLAEHNHGIAYLETHKIYDKLSKRIEQVKDFPVDTLLIPGLMKFFGKAAVIQPRKVIIGYPHMIESLFDCLDEADFSSLPTAFDTLSNLAFTQEGKTLLENNYRPRIEKFFETYQQQLKNLPGDLKVRFLSALEVMFAHQNNITTDISQIIKLWFVRFSGSSNLNSLAELYRNPFADIKMACLKLIAALCSYDWGIDAFKETAGLLEYMLDREAEFDKDVKYVKYEIVKLLLDSSAFDTQINLRLQKYVNDGPYFVATMMDVALEGQ